MADKCNQTIEFIAHRIIYIILNIYLDQSKYFVLSAPDNRMYMNRSQTEEDYLKAIYKLMEQGARKISTTGIAGYQETSPASVTDMLKRLSEKKLVHYTPYRGVSLTAPGRREAINIIRKHRLWEYFLVQKLGFRWDEVHEMAEQLEHVNSSIQFFNQHA